MTLKYKEEYDLIIIGGGAGAFASAIRANELKAKTLMVNKGLPLGGTCVNVGCVPSKMLLWAGEVMHQAKYHGIPGVEIEVKNFDFTQVVQHELDLVARLRAEKYEKVLNVLENVTHIEGRVTFIFPNEIEVDGPAVAKAMAGKQKYTAKKFIIAAGSTVTVPPIENIQEVGYLTHVEALQIKNQPKELIVVGAGPLGLEFAQMYLRFGTKVTILQRSTSIFPPAERELTDRLAIILTKEGITIKTSVQIKKAYKEGDKKVLVYKEADLSPDSAFVATSAKEAALAKGDEILLATENALSNTQNSIDYNTVPWTIFTDPQLAGVGLTEEQEMKQLGRCLCRTISLSDVPKAIIINRTEGLIKMAVHPDTKVILGIHILAPNAGELIAQAMALVKNKNTIDDVVNSLPMFPTLSEAIKIVALSFTKDISKLSCCI